MTFYPVRTDGPYTLDVEAFAASQLVEHPFLAVREVGSVRDFRNSVTAVVKECGLKTEHTESYVQQSVIYGSYNSVGRLQVLL